MPPTLNVVVAMWKLGVSSGAPVLPDPPCAGTLMFVGAILSGPIEEVSASDTLHSGNHKSEIANRQGRAGSRIVIVVAEVFDRCHDRG